MDYNEIYKNNIIDYKTIIGNSEIIIKNSNQIDNIDISIVIPIMGRGNQIKPLTKSFRNSFKQLKNKKYSLTFVEHDETPNNKNLITSTGANYIFIKREPGERFNKCLAMNVGSLIIKSKYYLFHDVDLLVKNDFFKNIFLNLERMDNNKVLHPISNKRVIYLNNEKSEMVRNNIIDINEINDDDIKPYEKFIHKDIMYGNIGAPGGSMFISSELFFKVGGYDDSFFSGYSPEDDFFWRKVETFEKINSCNDPKNEVFHLYHEPLHFTTLPIHEIIKSNFINSNLQTKLKYITLKSKNFMYE